MGAPQRRAAAERAQRLMTVSAGCICMLSCHMVRQPGCRAIFAPCEERIDGFLEPLTADIGAMS